MRIAEAQFLNNLTVTRLDASRTTLLLSLLCRSPPWPLRHSFGRTFSGGKVRLARLAATALGSSLPIQRVAHSLSFTDFSRTRVARAGRSAVPELRGVWLTGIRWVVTMTQSVGWGSN